MDRKPRRVAIHDIQVLSLHESGAVIRVRCSKGTYIRTLCEDIGRRLGYGAHMERLVRLQSGRFAREDSCTLDQIERHMREGHPEAFLQPLDRFFDELRSVTVGRSRMECSEMEIPCGFPGREGRIRRNCCECTHPSVSLSGCTGSRMCVPGRSG